MRTSKFEQTIKNNIKCNGNFSSLMKQIDKTLECKAISHPKKNKLSFLAPVVSVGAVLTQIAIILSVVLIAKSINNRHHGSIDNQSTTNVEPHSGETTKPYKKYQWFDFSNKQYRCANMEYETISENLIGENIAKLEIVATHSLGSKTEKTNISINLIKNIDQNYGIAVNFEGENGYYLYVTDVLESGINLQSFLSNAGLWDYGVFDSASYSYSEGDKSKTVIADNVDSLIREIVKKNYEVENVYSSDPSSPYNNFDTNISVKISLSLLGNVTTFLDINLDGRTTFSLVNDNTFVFDSDDISSLKDYILNNKI